MSDDSSASCVCCFLLQKCRFMRQLVDNLCSTMHVYTKPCRKLRVSSVWRSCWELEGHSVVTLVWPVSSLVRAHRDYFWIAVYVECVLAFHCYTEGPAVSWNSWPCFSTSKALCLDVREGQFSSLTQNWIGYDSNVIIKCFNHFVKKNLVLAWNMSRWLENVS